MMIINGIPATQISAQDRGLHYGDGLFETLRVTDGQPEWWSRHMTRLTHGCARLAIPLPDLDRLHHEALELTHDCARGVLKIILTRGSGGRGYRLPDTITPTRILSLHPYPTYPAAYWAEGVCVRLCDLRLARQPALAGIKHLNRLEQILARNEWQDETITEGLLRDAEDNFIEATMSNLFLVRDGVLTTPDLSGCGVRGIMRDLVLEQAEAHGIPTMITPVQSPHLMAADEVFLTNSIIGLWPVKQIISLKSYAVGPITRRLSACIAEFA
ncbi:MAG: aminodeoxychorismate lyase [Pseudomonadota bacterium]